MKDKNIFDVIIIGGSYAGLSAAMSLGRARKKTLIIDNGQPCNKKTPYSHNFLSRDGVSPAVISGIALEQVLQYPTVSLVSGTAVKGKQTDNFFIIQTSNGQSFSAAKLIFATGIRDLLPRIDGIEECWGISVIHCPFCHGYEVKDEKTGLLANGERAYDMAKMITNWTDNLTVYTNGPALLDSKQRITLKNRNVNIDERKIEKLTHVNGQLQNIIFTNSTMATLKALYVKVDFEQHCELPEQFGCELTDAGYLHIDETFQTTVKGVYAVGDNTGSMRTVAHAAGMGNAVGLIISKDLIFENF